MQSGRWQLPWPPDGTVERLPAGVLAGPVPVLPVPGAAGASPQVSQ